MERCELCGQSEEWHREHKPRHPFSGPDSGNAGKLNGKPEKSDKPAVARAIHSGDPALRIALVNAGIISYENIVQAEENLRSGHPVFFDTDAPTRSHVSVVEGGNGTHR